MVSVIVPVYNAEKYIDRCLQSILTQTYQALEVICVDDGSTDGSGKILDAYARKDGRVRVIYKQNGGANSARKAGLKAASSERVCWADSDDWMERDYIGSMVRAYEESGADIVAADMYNENYGTVTVTSGRVLAGLYQVEEILPVVMYAGEFFRQGIQPHLVTKLIRKDLLENAFDQVDDSISYGDDLAVFYGCLLEAKTILITDICGYHYDQHFQSIAHSLYPDERQRYDSLIGWLTRLFREYGKTGLMKKQLEAYKRYYIALRLVDAWDTSQEILFPYGGIEPDCSVVIYGAGIMGQHLHACLNNNKRTRVIAWLDGKYEDLYKRGLDVVSPESIQKLESFDYALIAVTSQAAAEEIRKKLIRLGTAPEKIRWLSDEFLDLEQSMELP